MARVQAPMRDQASLAAIVLVSHPSKVASWGRGGSQARGTQPFLIGKLGT